MGPPDYPPTVSGRDLQTHPGPLCRNGTHHGHPLSRGKSQGSRGRRNPSGHASSLPGTRLALGVTKDADENVQSRPLRMDHMCLAEIRASLKLLMHRRHMFHDPWKDKPRRHSVRDCLDRFMY